MRAKLQHKFQNSTVVCQICHFTLLWNYSAKWYETWKYRFKVEHVGIKHIQSTLWLLVKIWCVTNSLEMTSQKQKFHYSEIHHVQSFICQSYQAFSWWIILSVFLCFTIIVGNLVKWGCTEEKSVYCSLISIFFFIYLFIYFFYLFIFFFLVVVAVIYLTKVITHYIWKIIFVIPDTAFVWRWCRNLLSR